MSPWDRRYLTGHERDRPPEHLYLAVLRNGGPRASPHRGPKVTPYPRPLTDQLLAEIKLIFLSFNRDRFCSGERLASRSEEELVVLIRLLQSLN